VRPRRPGAVAGVLAQVLVLVSGAEAREWYATPSVSTQLEYNDNILLTSTGQQSVLGSITNVAAVTGVRSESGELRLVPRLRFRRYSDAALNADDQFLKVFAARRNERSELALAGAYIRDTTLVGGAEETGLAFTNERRTRWDVNPYWTYAVTPRTDLRLAYSYVGTSYQDSGQFGLFDFTSQLAEVSVDYQIGERDRVGVGAFTSLFGAPQAFNNETDTIGVQATYHRFLSETVQGDFTLGLRSSDQTFRADDQRFTERNTGGAGSIALTKLWERATLKTSLARELRPSGRGLVLVRDQLGVSATRDFTAHLAGLLGLLAFREDSLGGNVPTVERDYAQARLNLRWRLARWWFLEGDYRYVWQKFESAPGFAQSNTIGLQIRYGGRKRATSR
jgi:hypothetical protein